MEWGKQIQRLGFLIGVLTLMHPLLAEEGTITDSEVAKPSVSKSPLPEGSKISSTDADGEVKPFLGKEKQLTIPLGLPRIMEFDFEIGSIYQGDPNLFSYTRIRQNGKETKLRIKPENPGFTDLIIHDTNNVPRIRYMVRITREDLSQVISQLDELLGDIEGLKIKTVGGTIILDGEILLPKDAIRIIRVLDAVRERDPRKKETPIRNLTTISKMTMNILAERIEREIGSPEITVRVINNNLFLEGTAESEFEADRAVEIAKTYLPEVQVEKTKGDGVEIKPKQFGGVGGGLPTIIDLLRVRPRQSSPPSQDIKITMNYVELSNEYNKTFNFEWRPLASDASSVKFDTSLGELTGGIVAIVSGLLPKLENLRSHSHAKILRQQSVIVKDRSEAPAVIKSSITFYAQVPNPQVPGGAGQLQPIPVNNETKVKAAVIPGTDSIDLGIQISLGTVLSMGAGGPTIANNELQTQVTIKNGDSAALGGNAIDQALAGYNRDLPGSGGAGPGQQQGGSPLFNAQRSKRYQREKAQYIIFITPEILRTASAGTEELTRKFRLNSGEQ